MINNHVRDLKRLYYIDLPVKEIVQINIDSILKMLRVARDEATLEFAFIYCDGLVQGLEIAGILTNEQATQIIDLRDKIYNEKKDEILRRKKNEDN